jgi:2-polyprenyl-6-methoxyphenol hydroxylase-like FAD-dependent oxidoreductase
MTCAQLMTGDKRMSKPDRIETDVFIVGGGPAGLATGIAARRKGFRVVIADYARPPIDKACGEGLLPDALAALDRLGVAMPNETGYPFAGIRFVDYRSRVTARFPKGRGLGIRRTRLHEILIQSAGRAGTSLLWGSNVEWSPSGSLRVNGIPVLCRWIVGADGQKSRVRDWAGIQVHSVQHIRFGFRCHFRAQPWTDCVEVHWGAGCQLFVTPISPSELCLAMITRDPRLRFDTALSQFPEIIRRLRGSARTTVLRGALSVQRSVREVAKDNFVLVGDASGSVDAVSGEGLCLSFRQAECLANALAQENLELYRQGHRQIQRVASVMARLMLLMDGIPILRSTVLHLFKCYPVLFSALLARHLESRTPTPPLQDLGKALLKTPDISKC